MVAFDEALDVVLAFRKQHPDTLVVITTDHGNGNMAANGTGSAYGQSSWMFRHTAAVKWSFTEIMKQLKRKPVIEDNEEKKDADAGGFNASQNAKSKEIDNDPANKKAGAETKAQPVGGRRSTQPRDYVPTPAEAVEIIYACTGYKPSERRAGLLLPYMEKKGTPVYDLMNNDMIQLGQLVGNRIGIGWTGNAHTADFVPVLSVGPGAERFAGFIQNVDVFKHYTQLAKIDFKNPTEDLIAGMGGDASDVEKIGEYAAV